MTEHVVDIVVRGTLGPALAGALDGFTVEDRGDGTTSVRGAVVDQAALLGLLRMLDDLRVEVVSVNRVPAA
ncbi:hypothetical protein [Microbacterium sp. NPDC077184]|uniref:hypothetical protein n=1 Tax=Microbacterium sp. NPDC077184 TaxID=3154764 RepID=UPI003440C67B